jgi:hypothetical protein
MFFTIHVSNAFINHQFALKLTPTAQKLKPVNGWPSHLRKQM